MRLRCASCAAQTDDSARARCTHLQEVIRVYDAQK